MGCRELLHCAQKGQGQRQRENPPLVAHNLAQQLISLGLLLGVLLLLVALQKVFEVVTSRCTTFLSQSLSTSCLCRLPFQLLLLVDFLRHLMMSIACLNSSKNTIIVTECIAFI